MKKIIVKPGQNAPKSGQYMEVGPRGKEKKEVTAVKGKVMPPTEKPNSHFELVDRTDNKSGNS